jgi:hypothetical protein
MNLRCGYGADTVRIRCGFLEGRGLVPGIVKLNGFMSSRVAEGGLDGAVVMETAVGMCKR